MRNLTEDVLTYLDNNEIPEQWFANDLGNKSLILNEDFLDEMELQIQINDTELDTAVNPDSI